MPQMWFLRVGDQERGPISSQQLKLLAAKGKLKRSDFVRVAERSNWIPAERVSGLFEPQAVSSQPQSDTSPSSKGDQDIENRASWWLQMGVRIVHWIFIHLARRPKATLAVACLLAVVSLFWFSTTGSVDPKLAQIGQPHRVDLSQLDMRSDMSQLHVDQSNSIQAKEKKGDGEAQEQQVQNAARREKEDLQHRERVVKADAELSEATRKAEEDLKEFREKERQLAKAKAEKEERQAKVLADKLYEGISFDPEKCVFLSKSLREAGATVEFIGKDYKKVRELFDNRDWAKLSFPSGQNKVPFEWTCRNVLTGFNELHSWDVNLLVRTSKKYKEGLIDDHPLISALVFPISLDLSTMYETNMDELLHADGNNDAVVDTVRFEPRKIDLHLITEKHPDKIGYYGSWSPQSLVILFVDLPLFNQHGPEYLRQIEEELNETERQLRSRQSLGQLSEQDVKREFTRAVARHFQDAKKWAERH